MKALYKSLQLLAISILISIIHIDCREDSGNIEASASAVLLKRNSVLSYDLEWANIQRNEKAYKQKLRKDPNDSRSLVGLVSLYLSEARITGNYEHYNSAARGCINRILTLKPDNYEALTFKATILLSEHQFQAALDIAEQLRKRFPHNAYIDGIITDAQLELGNYESAIEAADRMISLRPDIRSYSRIAYLREIHGDIPGAIDAMKMAIDAGAPGDENTEWCRVQLGKLYEQSGKTKEAKMSYQTALENRKNFPPALNGLARLAFDETDYAKGLSLYLRADSIISDHCSMEGIAAVYEEMGQKEKATEVRRNIFNVMKKYAGDGNAPKSEGQNEDHEMAHACLGMGDLNLALKYASVEYQRRPGNIEVNETMATILAKRGEYAEAVPYINNALRTHCKKKELIELARVIYSQTGQISMASLPYTESTQGQ